MITPPMDQLTGIHTLRDTGASANAWFGAGLSDPVADDVDDFERDEELASIWEQGVRDTPDLPQAMSRAMSEERLAVLFAAVASRDERALAALYDCTLRRVHGLALSIVRSPALAEEVAADTYLQVWRQALRFDPARGSRMAWLLGMTRSRAIDALRREARFQHQSLDHRTAAEVADDKLAGDDLLYATQGHVELHRALMLLSPRPRQLVALAFFRGLSHEEIAAQTALPLGTVKSQIRRAMLSLRRALGELSPDGASGTALNWRGVAGAAFPAVRPSCGPAA